MANVIIYRDGEQLHEIVQHINDMCGALLSDPRPDLRGDFIVKDIVGVSHSETDKGWVVLAILALRRQSNPFSEPEIGVFMREQTELADSPIVE